MHGDITHIDIPVSDHVKAREFYGELFGWQFNEYPGFEGYPMWQAPNQISGGGLAPRGEGFNQPCSYVLVDSIGDVLAAFQRHLPDLEYRVVPEAEANYLVDGGDPGPIPSNARLRADFGWSPTTSFDDGMRLYLDWVLANGPQ